MLKISMVLPNWSMILTKFVCNVTKFVYAVTDVFDVTTISQDYICSWQSSIIYIRTANKLLPRRAVLLILIFYSINYNIPPAFMPRGI